MNGQEKMLLMEHHTRTDDALGHPEDAHHPLNLPIEEGHLPENVSALALLRLFMTRLLPKGGVRVVLLPDVDEMSLLISNDS